MLLLTMFFLKTELISIEWTDGAPSTDIDFKTYDEALAEYNRWGF